MQCQNERSQLQNKAQAMRILKSRLLEREREEREAALAKERGEAQDISFGSQIRSYVLHPYTMVNDHRTNLKIGNAQGVLDGDLDELDPRRAPAPRGSRRLIGAAHGRVGRSGNARLRLRLSGRTGTLEPGRHRPSAATRSRP